MLLVHEAAGFRDRGMSVSLSYNPTPSTPLGLTARVAPSWGGRADGGAEALWRGGPVAELDATGDQAVGGTPGCGGRLRAPGRDALGRDATGLAWEPPSGGVSTGWATAWAGWAERGWISSWAFEAQRRESPVRPGPDQGRPRAGHGALVGRPPAGPAVV